MAKRLTESIKGIYEKEYKKLLILPILLLVLAVAQISYQYATTGDFINRGISLKGGLTLSVNTDVEEHIFREFLGENYPKNEYNVRTISSAGTQSGIIIEMDIPLDDEEVINSLVSEISRISGVPDDDINIEGIGSALSDSFFRTMLQAVLFAFIFMAIVVFLYFRNFIPSFAVVLCAFSDMVVTVAAVNLLGIKLSTAGVAAFLMMIGYSVDTDILLTIRVLKGKTGTVMERIYGSISTGFTMNITTLAAITIAFFLSDSDTIRQIMLILIIGLLVDMINTWIQNVAIIRLYLEKKGRQ